MIFIIHKVNKIKHLKKIDFALGVEVDLRSDGSNIVLNHDAFDKGELFKDYLSIYNHKFIVCNIKESGIEAEVIKIMKEFSISNYFLLDVEFPFIFESFKKKFKKIAIRESKYEQYKYKKIKNFYNKFNWVWIDTYNKIDINRLSTSNKYKCLVCPSRWKKYKDIEYYKNLISKENNIDAIMTDEKNLKLWL